MMKNWRVRRSYMVNCNVSLRPKEYPDGYYWKPLYTVQICFSEQKIWYKQALTALNHACSGSNPLSVKKFFNCLFLFISASLSAVLSNHNPWVSYTHNTNPVTLITKKSNVTLKRVSKDQTRGGDFSNLLGTDESLRLNREKVASI